MSLQAPIKAIYFDLDDTLCAYWDAAKDGLKTAFTELGPAEHPTEIWLSHWAAAFREFCPTIKKSDWYPIYLQNGEPTRTELMRLTLLKGGMDDQSLAKRISDRYGEARDQALVLFEDALEALELAQSIGPVGLITNGPADIQRQEVNSLGIAHRFDHILIEGEMGIGKPHESVFQRALELAKASAAEALFVGNSYDHDIRPAIAAGWQTYWVRRESDVPPSALGAAEHMESIGNEDPQPTMTGPSFAELIEALKKIK